MYGYLRQDDDSHWYLLPEDLLNDFDNLMDKLVTASWEERDNIAEIVIDKFDEYRLSGGPYDLKIEMENKNE